MSFDSAFCCDEPFDFGPCGLDKLLKSSRVVRPKKPPGGALPEVLNELLLFCLAKSAKLIWLAEFRDKSVAVSVDGCCWATEANVRPELLLPKNDGVLADAFAGVDVPSVETGVRAEPNEKFEKLGVDVVVAADEIAPKMLLPGVDEAKDEPKSGFEVSEN